MNKEVTIPGLPRGVGAAMSAYVRSLALIGTPYYTIIGMNVCDKSLFDTLGNNTTIVSDVAMMFTGYDYSLAEDIVAKSPVVGHISNNGGMNSDVHAVSFTLDNVNSISTSDFGFYHTAKERKIAFACPISTFSITFYICKVTGVISKDVALLGLVADDKALPFPAAGKSQAAIYGTLEQSTFSEDLVLHVNGEPEEAKAALNSLVDTFKQYTEKLQEALENLS